MESRSQLLLQVRRKKLTALAGGILLLFAALQFRLMDIILIFCFYGAVPGTDIVIDPTVMLWGQAILAFCLMLVLVARITLRRNQRRRYAALRTPLLTSLAQAAIAETAKPVAKRQPKVPRRKNRSIRTFFGSIARSVTGSAGVFLAIIRHFAQFMSVMLGAFLVLVYSVIAKAVRAVNGVCRALLRISMRVASDIWAWAEPHLWRFDGWLEIQVHEVLAWIRSRIEASEPLRMILAMVQDYRRTPGPMQSEALRERSQPPVEQSE